MFSSSYIARPFNFLTYRKELECSSIFSQESVKSYDLAANIFSAINSKNLWILILAIATLGFSSCVFYTVHQTTYLESLAEYTPGRGSGSPSRGRPMTSTPKYGEFNLNV